jgi:Fe-S-cluster containining protein
MTYKYTDDDYCDIYESKICDNCGKCLELEGIDTKAIKIEDIAKTKEENELLEEEFLSDLKTSLTEDELHEIDEENLDLKDIYSKFGKITNEIDDSEEDYEDAFEHIEFLDEIGLNNDSAMDEMTEEIYPGIRKLKKSIE